MMKTAAAIPEKNVVSTSTEKFASLKTTHSAAPLLSRNAMDHVSLMKINAALQAKNGVSTRRNVYPLPNAAPTKHGNIANLNKLA